MERMERMTEAEWRMVQTQMREKYAVHYSEVEQHISEGLAEGEPPADPEETGDDEWG